MELKSPNYCNVSIDGFVSWFRFLSSSGVIDNVQVFSVERVVQITGSVRAEAQLSACEYFPSRWDDEHGHVFESQNNREAVHGATGCWLVTYTGSARFGLSIKPLLGNAALFISRTNPPRVIS
jgi:hypothetical protein